MATDVESAPEPALLIIADISGYTGYMTANAKALAHGQALITELVKAILKQVELPLKVAKLEGDAVFLFARKGDSPTWTYDRKLIGQKLLKLFESFTGKVNELGSATTCTCNACTHVQKLRLKVIVHSGEVLFHKVMEFEELAGVDVIIVHRLLKNSIKADQYLLLTKQAQNDIKLPADIGLTRSKELCDGIGEIEVGVHYPNGAVARSIDVVPVSFSARFVSSWRLSAKLWLKAMVPGPTASSRTFNHLAPAGRKAGRIGLALVTLILTPVYLPLAAVFAFAHVLKKPHAIPEHTHEHNADGSCCGLKVKSE